MFIFDKSSLSSLFVQVIHSFSLLVNFSFFAFNLEPSADLAFIEFMLVRR